MTFEQWWAKNYDTRLRAIPIEDPSDAELKSFAAACWNAALDSACGLRQPHWNREEVTEMLEEFRA